LTVNVSYLNLIELGLGDLCESRNICCEISLHIFVKVEYIERIVYSMCHVNVYVQYMVTRTAHELNGIFIQNNHHHKVFYKIIAITKKRFIIILFTAKV